MIVVRLSGQNVGIFNVFVLDSSVCLCSMNPSSIGVVNRTRQVPEALAWGYLLRFHIDMSDILVTPPTPTAAMPKTVAPSSPVKPSPGLRGSACRGTSPEYWAFAEKVEQLADICGVPCLGHDGR